MEYQILPQLSVVDPGFPRGGGANSPGGGCQHTILPSFPPKLHEIERIWTQGGGTRPSCPLDLPLVMVVFLHHHMTGNGLTVRCKVYLLGGVPALGDVPAWGCTCWGRYLFQGGTPAWVVYLPGGGGVPARGRGVYLPGGTCSRGCTCSGGCTCLGVYLLGGGTCSRGCTCPRGVPA